MRGKWLTIIICIMLLIFGIAVAALVQKRAKIPDLIEQMGAADYGDAYDAMRELITMRGLVVDAVCDVLDPKNLTYTDVQRSRAAMVLGEVGGERAVPVLLEALGRFEGKDVRWNCIVALGKLGATEAREDLIDIFQNEKLDKVVRLTAIRTLGLLRAKDAVGPLTAQLEKRPDAQQVTAYRRDEERKARQRKLYEDAGEEVPEELLATPAPTDETDAYQPQLRIASCEALALIGDDSDTVLEALSEAADKDHEPEYSVRTAATMALGDLGGPSDGGAVDVLIDNLRDEQWDMNADDIDDDDDGDLRVAAAYALGRLSSEDDAVLASLQRAARDKQYWVRLTAAESLKKLGGEVESD